MKIIFISIKTEIPKKISFEGGGIEYLFKISADEIQSNPVNIVAVIFPKCTFFLNRNAIPQNTIQSIRITGASSKEPPAAVAKPLPPLNFNQGEKQCPATPNIKAVAPLKYVFPNKTLDR